VILKNITNLGEHNLPKNNKGQHHLEIISMNATLHGIIIMVGVLSIFTSSYMQVSATELNSLDPTTNNFSQNLKSKINNIISNALNDTNNSSTLLTNESNSTSSQVIISKSKVLSTTSSNTSDSNSIIKNEIKTINGVCSSNKVGGNGNDTLASSGKCNDQLTGGSGADKFICGEGKDTVKDFNSKEGDVILDRQNCEKIL